jgi:hypothetical protein
MASGFYRHRPTRVRARQASAGQVVRTPHGRVLTNAGDWVVTFEDGGGFDLLVPDWLFRRHYEVDESPEAPEDGPADR